VTKHLYVGHDTWFYVPFRRSTINGTTKSTNVKRIHVMVTYKNLPGNVFNLHVYVHALGMYSFF
jgi:hypothetical protein